MAYPSWRLVVNIIAFGFVACATQSGSTGGGHTGPRPPAVVSAPPGLAVVTLELVTTETNEAVGLVAAPEPPGRLFVVEKKGFVRILRGNTVASTPFLDVSTLVQLDDRDNGEQGLLGLAFHPDFAENGRFFVNYTAAPNGTTRIEERMVSKTDPERASDDPAKLVFSVEQPYSNHNAGDLTFGPDGKLYFGLGDGGSANDPHKNGQNPNAKLGKVFRLNVDAASANVKLLAPELLAIGVRNPWRIAFDSETGDLFVADVGQGRFEYVHLLSAAQLAGSFDKPVNLGWNVMEGFHCREGESCDASPFQPPIVEYDHKTGCSITGGYVYRGKALPELTGRYFYGDYCTAIVHSLRVDEGRAVDVWDWKPTLDPDSRLARVASFGRDHDGELYIVTHEGPIYKLVRR